MTALRTDRDLRWVWIASELLLVATSVASIRLLTRIFEDTTFFAPMVFSVIVCHAVLVAMRWFGFGAAVSGLVSFVAVVFSIVATHYSASAAAVIVPTAATIDQFNVDLEVAGDLFNSLTTPVPAVTGFVVAGSLIYWVLAFAADWAAFRLFSPGQALVPALTVLIFVSLLGVEDERIPTTAALVVAGVLFVLAHRSASRAVQGIWLDAGPGRGYTALMVAGGVVAVIAALAGVLGGPAVPGADEAPLVEIGSDGRRDNRPIEVISPLVQIQPRLVDQSDEELFSVETDQRAYWRIAALDIFDGLLWRSQGQFGSAGGRLDVAFPANVPATNVTSVFDLGPLNVVWAPSPYLPVGLENLTEGVDINYESESATFIVDTKDQRVSNGLRYRVDAQVSSLTAPLLRDLASAGTGTIDARYLALPADFSPLARAEAERITAGLTNDYDRALALQNHFRENFAYDIDVAKGHDIARIEDFLTVQRGYCEQFAGTYAAMARAIGIPARVATGFTPGDQDPANPNRYVVSGRHAHAWPEVWIAGAGWVAFEPTPGRGAPNATEYTGVPESQDSSGAADADQGAEEQAAGAAPTPTPVPPEQQPFEPIEIEPELELAEEAAQADDRRSVAPWILLVAVVALAAWALGIPALKRLRDQRRRDRLGEDTRRLVVLEWAALVDRLERAGHPPHATETLLEYADRVQRDLPLAAPAFGELTELAVAAAYDGEPPTADDADRAVELSGRITGEMQAQQPWMVRSAHGVDPRPLLRWRDPIVTRSERLARGAVRFADDDEPVEDLDPLIPQP